MVKLRHVGIVVKNLPKALAFYKQLGFGLIVSKQTEYTSKDTLYMVKLNSEIELTHGRIAGEGTIVTAKVNSQIELIKGNWMNHFALTVDHLNNFKLPDKPIFQKETKTARVCYIQDPDGNVIELVEEKQ